MVGHPAHVMAPGPPTFELHTLGWRAFQDLCGAVVRTVWGQSAQAFADSNDAGRDGAFYGVWRDPPESMGLHDLLRGPFVLQCKHTKKAGSTLSPGDLVGEFYKVPSLVECGLCRSYVLMTNARVTGNSEEKILDRLREAGVEHPLVLGGQWVCDTIAAHRQLRLFVPRVYGLGDLSQILDERAYAQASVLIEAARDQVATFVITDPYNKAAQALQDHGFVLLLGEPAVGKSVIALMLALAAADNWGCATVKARTASELVAHWNPHEPNQFFWVDDAFGDVRHDEQLTQDWARSMHHVMAAINKGAKIVLTSRGYIYRDARRFLKEYAYPLLREQKVIVDVEDLTPDERKQILYSHIAQGDHTQEVRAAMKPFLDHAAAAEPFRPEMAHRLGLRAFTGRLTITEVGILEFMTHPREFLRDVYERFTADQQAALALVYASGADGSLQNPITLTDGQCDIINRAGSTPAGVVRALEALTGSFLRATGPPFAEPGWTFHHPTLWEGFASWVPTQSHLLTVVLAGLTDDALLYRVGCEAENAEGTRGTLLRVPAALYRPVAERLAAIRLQPFTGQKWHMRRGESVSTGSYNEHHGRRSAVLSFLARKSSDSFLRVYLTVDPDLLGSLVRFTSYLSVVQEPNVLARLHQADLLSESIRLEAVEQVTDLAVETPDSGWLKGDAWKVLLRPHERVLIMERVRTELVGQLEYDIDWLGEGRELGYDPVVSALRGYEEAFQNEGDHETARAFAEVLRRYSELPERFYDDDDRLDRRPLTGSRLAPPPSTGRSMFDDIDA